MNSFAVKLDDPVIIAQADPSIRHWGPFQFPLIERLPDGRRSCAYHIEADSASSYGKVPGYAVSMDEGRTWKPALTAMRAGILLPNGDRIRTASKVPANLTKEELLLPRACETVIDSGRVSLYDPDALPQKYGGYWFLRKKAGSSEWVEERAELHVPFAMREYYDGLGGIVPYQIFWRLRLAPDGTLWGVTYQFTWRDGVSRMAAIFAVSDDCGYHFTWRSTVYYEPDKKDRYWAIRTGYTEPDLAFLPDGSLMCLLRTDDSYNCGPMYYARSKDMGYTWTKPERFDSFGVWPCFLSLRCGVTLLGYGRPGLFLRASADPAGMEWGDKVTIVPDTVSAEALHLWGEQDTTCSYCDMIALSDDSFYLVYSDFNVPDFSGKPCKTILGRKGTVNM